MIPILPYNTPYALFLIEAPYTLLLIERPVLVLVQVRTISYLTDLAAFTRDYDTSSPTS
jgi:hypothetical protein